MAGSMAGRMILPKERISSNLKGWRPGLLIAALVCAGCADSSGSSSESASQLASDAIYPSLDRLNSNDFISSNRTLSGAIDGEAAGEFASSGGGSDGSKVPQLRLNVSSQSVNEGESVTLSWTASGASQCQASGGWSGQRDTSGSQVVGPLTGETTFSLSCTGSGGTALDMAAVSVVGPVTLSWIPPEQNVDGSDLVDLAGYKVYVGEESRDYPSHVEITDPSVTSHSMELPSGQYYLAMTAFDTEGNESAYSNEIQRSRP